MASSLLRLARYFPEVELRAGCEKALATLGIDSKRYMGMALSLSLVFAIFALFASLLFSLALPIVVIASVLVFALAFAFFISLPGMELKKRTSEIEAAMPFFLRGMGMLIDMGVPFHRAMYIASEGSGALFEEMGVVCRQANEGLPLQKALASFALSFPSLAIKRAISQMICAYETGGAGSEMRKIGDELLSLETHRLKEYASKSAMFGLLFLISSAVFPTFFLVYSMAGSFGMGSNVGDGELKLMMLVVFPSISFLVLLLSKASMPRSAFSGEGKMDARLLSPGIISLAGLVLFPGFSLLFIAAGSIIGGYLAVSAYRAEKRMEEIEAALPDALFSVSGLPGSTRPERIFSLIESGGFGALSEEAGMSRRQLEMNVGIGEALDDLPERCPSMMVRRACVMLRQMIQTNSLGRLSALAEDMIRGFQAKRERSNLFSMQKYTLIFGALLIPLILNMALGLMEDMGDALGAMKGSETEGDTGWTIPNDGDGTQGNVADTGASGVAASIVPPYLVIYSIMASLAISDAEGKRSAAAIYSVALSALSLLAFHFIK